MTGHARPIPEPDDRTAPFFEGAGRGALVIPRCAACATWLAPGAAACTECWSEALEWREASGRATLYTFGVMHQPYHPAFDLPYPLVEVELDEGPRLNTVVAGTPPEALRVGMRLLADFEPVGGGRVSVPVFRAIS